MKETYTTPEMETVLFDCEDVISTRVVIEPEENETPIVDLT